MALKSARFMVPTSTSPEMIHAVTFTSRYVGHGFVSYEGHSDTLGPVVYYPKTRRLIQPGILGHHVVEVSRN